MSNEAGTKVLWWLCLLLAPAVLFTIELFHPAGFTRDPGMYEYLSKPEPCNPQYKALAYFGPTWWFTLHMIQTLMMGLVAVGLWVLVDGITASHGSAALIAAWLSRVATFVFFVYYTALDSIGGIGLFLATQAPWPALLLPVGFGWELQVSHTMPHGPIAFGLFIIFTLWIWWKVEPSSR